MGPPRATAVSGSGAAPNTIATVARPEAGCVHCGLPTPGNADFCCPGCESAHAIIAGHGLERFYRDRTFDPAVRATRPAGEDIPDLTGLAREGKPGQWAIDLMVDGLHCAACVWLIESMLARDAAVTWARVNMTTRRLALRWSGAAGDANRLAARIAALGYRVAPFSPEAVDAAGAADDRALLRALAVTGFAASNIMLLSISVWAGAVQDMGPATRGLMHWISALIAAPAVLYGGRPFFRSAFQALAARRVNMDVPISLAVLLTLGVSLAETAAGGTHVYFESAVMLLFFLLIGRTLDRRARRKAHDAAAHLLALQMRPVTVLADDGARRSVPANQVSPGMTVHVAAGERIGVDGRIGSGESTVDGSLISGESLPRPVAPGEKVYAGMVNLGAPVTVRAETTGDGTLLAEIVQLMEAAETGRAAYRTLSERVARLYAPVVHGLALITFAGWYLGAGAAWQTALLYAVAVLIVTCPCALALAAPVVQVLASGNLLRRGILLKSPSALERLADTDMVVFDKTGTLTMGRPELVDAGGIGTQDLKLAASVCAASTHPLARAVCRAAPLTAIRAGVSEVPGRGLRATDGAGEIRIGNRAWCGVGEDPDTSGSGPELWMAGPGRDPVRFLFEDKLREDAPQTVSQLRDLGFDLAMLSGDREAVAAQVASQLGIPVWTAGVDPAGKVRYLEALQAKGRKTLMVGDGLNDAPALAAAHVSMSPATAADVSQTAADAVFQGTRLGAVVAAIRMSLRAARLVRQNFGFALAYNAVMIPLAVAGYVTPLIAAAAMSASSLAVVANALRLNRADLS